MSVELALIGAAVLVIAAVLTGAMRRFALSSGVLDIPNERSSHTQPTPRGGGVAIVVGASLAVFLLSVRGVVPRDLAIALLGGIAVAFVGFIDDRSGVPPVLRLLVHFAAAMWALAWLGGLPDVQLGHHRVESGWLGYLLGALGIVWTLNLFNFMDGIDGIAASEAVFVACAGAVLGIVAGSLSPVGIVGVMFAAACGGFLLWNWPPARIFMGDVGSGYAGFFIAVLAVAATRENPVAPLVWLILGGVFFADATVALLRRLARGESVHQAHRSHAYQVLARRWRSHRRVTIAVLLVNVAWLLPWALAAVCHPSAAPWIALAALTPVIIAAFLAGSGRKEVS